MVRPGPSSGEWKEIFVRRAHGVTDRRHVYVTLTASGSRVLSKVAVLHRREMRVRSPEMIKALLRLRK